MEREVFVRRAVHCAIALAPVYFLLPVELPVAGLRRWVLLVAFFASVAVFDFWRRGRGITFLGLRPHERWGVASFLWAAAGITFVLWLIPPDVATASLVAMALADPVAGELRRAGRRGALVVGASFTTYFGIVMTALVFTGTWSSWGAALTSLIGAGVAIPSESIKTRYVDDDFTMLVFPAIAMSWLAGVV